MRLNEARGSDGGSKAWLIPRERERDYTVPASLRLISILHRSLVSYQMFPRHHPSLPPGSVKNLKLELKEGRPDVALSVSRSISGKLAL